MVIASRDRLGEPPGALLGRLGGLLGRLGAILSRLETLLELLGVSGSVLAASWCSLGPSGGHLGPEKVMRPNAGHPERSGRSEILGSGPLIVNPQD